MKLDVVEVHVRDWEKMVRWYSEILGLKLLAKEDDHKFALVGGKNGAKIGLFQTKGAIAVSKRIILNWRVEDINQSVDELSKLGVKFPKGIEDRHWGKKADFVDPEGNKHFLYEEKRDF